MTTQRAPLQSPGSLGRAAQQARLARGMTQAQLAVELDIAPSAISEIENGKATIYIRRYFDIMRATGMTLTATWEDEDAGEQAEQQDADRLAEQQREEEEHDDAPRG